MDILNMTLEISRLSAENYFLRQKIKELETQKVLDKKRIKRRIR